MGSFLGTYGRHISNFGYLAWPLFQLLREGSDTKWHKRHTHAVHALKSNLVKSTLMRVYDPDLPVVSKTDASRHAVGDSPEQKGYPMAFGPRELSESESQWPPMT